MTTDTKQALIAAGQRLFAERGIDGASLREITRAAGQRNTGALQYHFGDREGFLVAILQQHSRDIDGHRKVLLDSAEASGYENPRLFASAVVMPPVAKLDEMDGGPQFLRILGELLMQPRRFSTPLAAVAETPQMARWSSLVEPLLPPEALGRPLHRRSAIFRFVHAELAARARERPSGNHLLFANHLIDLVMAMLTAPLSVETARWVRSEST